ncbi:transposase [Siccirubricoccus sp. G192]|uniref:IS66 family transposase n=1 Tax=Siccirubricoccus sp. G192 TaxID=2849651 RepID=UPI001C2C7533|nr:transposase [Siccirubricoccus sp. G192]MBV1798748.1 transposase [Siccirubricoccus sp. G192]
MEQRTNGGTGRQAEDVEAPDLRTQQLRSPQAPRAPRRLNHASCGRATETGQTQIHYADLKAYQREPSRRRRAELRVRFERIFKRRTGFVVLDRLLERLHANKVELLQGLDHPEIPLHTNGSENDIRAQVTRRKISGGTRSDMGRDCRDAFLGLAKTCTKLGLSFWDYLGARLGIAGQPTIPYLPDLVRARCQNA